MSAGFEQQCYVKVIIRNGWMPVSLALRTKQQNWPPEIDKKILGAFVGKQGQYVILYFHMTIIMNGSCGLFDLSSNAIDSLSGGLHGSYHSLIRRLLFVYLVNTSAFHL